ncbi:hypothetical protein PINS_up009462 [Pythium insidiosum]|nr:hypothetical protein PINS_up009462 [Pythium insidiosum]
MSSSVNGYDRRYSSIAGDLDAAIERVVSHFEDNDVALRLDVLRGLAVHAKLAFETERIKERLRQHPVTKELIERVVTRSTVYERLHRALAVEGYSCDYDRERNVEMRATVRWELAHDSQREGRAKASKKGAPQRKKRRTTAGPMWSTHTFSRQLSEDGASTLIEYAVSLSFGADGSPMELVRFALESATPYPRSFYEDDNGMESDEEEGEEEAEHTEEEEEEEEEKTPVKETEDDDDSEGGDEGSDSGSEGGHADPFGEEIRGFEFGEEAMDRLLEWIDAESEELDPSDVIGFLLALPVYEDDWMIDERIGQILFGGMGDSEADYEEIIDDEEEGDEEEEEAADVDLD